MLLSSVATCGSPVFAGSDVSGYVTSLKTSKSTVDTGNTVNIEVEFSDRNPGHAVFKGGDSFTIEWPGKESGAEAYLQGYSATIPLYSASGVEFAEAQVTPSGAKVVFNDKVNGLHDVRGGFKFTARAINKDPGETESEHPVTIRIGGTTTTIRVRKPETGASEGAGELPDFRKNPSIDGSAYQSIKVDGKDVYAMTLDPEDPTYTRWHVSLNENKQYIASEVKIYDCIGQGQKLRKESDVLLYYQDIDGKGKNYEGSLTDVQRKLKADFPRASLTVDEDDNLSLVLDQETANYRAWYLFYACDITDFSRSYFDNSAQADFQMWQKSVSTRDTKYFVGVDQSGWLHGVPKGMIKVTKVIAGTKYPINGVEFTVEKKHKSGRWDKVGTITTDESGEGFLKKMDSGHYRLYETKAPDYLKKAYTAEQPYEFDLNINDPEEQGLNLTVENELKKEDITATKQWNNADGTQNDDPHPDIWFRLMRKSCVQGDLPVGEVRVLKHGAAEVTWKNMPKTDIDGNAYTYSVREVDKDGRDWQPEGYEKQENGLRVINTKRDVPKGSLELSKKVSGSLGDFKKSFAFTITVHEKGKPVSGSYVTVNEKGRESEVTFSDGKAKVRLKDSESLTIKELPAAYTYTIEEIDADGYSTKINGKPDADRKVEGSADEKTVVAAYENNKEGMLVTGLTRSKRAWLLLPLLLATAGIAVRRNRRIRNRQIGQKG